MSFDFLRSFFATKPAVAPRVPAAINDSAAPSVTDQVIGLANQVGGWVKQKTQEGLDAPSVKKATEMAGSALQGADKAVYAVIQCLTEAVDLGNAGGTKDPSLSIKNSHDRLSKHDKPFANCLEFLADQAAQQYVEHADSISSVLGGLIRGENKPKEDESYSVKAKSTFFGSSADVAEWLLNLSKDLIGQTIKANILHIAANLADEGFDPSKPFADNQRNPLGRLLSVVSKSWIASEARLQRIALLPQDQQPAEYKREFEALSKDLLAKFFPKGAQDLQLFHHTLPFIHVAKDLLWDKINQHLPALLERLYRETRPISESEENKDWKEAFDKNFHSVKADQLMQLLSVFMKHVVRKDKGKWLEDKTPELEKLLWKQGVKAPQAAAIIKYIKELVLTEDASLHKTAAFFERYFMEHLLYSLAYYGLEESEEVSEEVEELSEALEEEGPPVPFRMVKQWIPGNVFKMLTYALSGKDMEAEEKAQAVQELLTPFGLNREDTFPLPPMVKEGLWKTIDKFEQEELPDLIFKAIPSWVSLIKQTSYRHKIDHQLADASLTNTVSAITGKIIDEQLPTLAEISLAQLLNEANDYALPSLMLSEEQQEQMDAQWQSIFKEQDLLDRLKDFGKQCAEALMQQLFLDLYERYQKVYQPEEDAHYLGIGMRWLFDDVDLGNEIELPTKPSFVKWLFLEGTKAFENLGVEGFSNNEIKALREAIQLRDGLRDPAKDPAEAKKDRAELDKLWIKIEPKFQFLTRHLLETLGYEKAANLPFPALVQPWIWKNLNNQVPRLIFEQMGDVLLPVLEKKNLQEKVDALPKSDFIKRGCHSVVQDIVDHLSEFVKKDDLQKLIEKQPDLKFTDKAKTYAVDNLTAIINQEHPAYEPIWQWIASYLEGMLLKLTIGLSKISQDDLQTIHTLAEKTRSDVLALEDDEEIDDEKQAADIQKVLIAFTDQLLAILGIQMTQDLFGIPRAVQSTVLKEMKAEIAQKLLGVYRVEHKIRTHVVRPNAAEDIIPTSAFQKAILNLTHYALDITTDELTKRADGKVKVISKMYDSLNKQLDKQAEKGFQTAELFKDVIKDELPTPLLTHLFDVLDAPSAQAYKQEFAEWINPLLTDQAIQLLAPILQKEQGQAEFDQALLMALVPALTQHLRHLNQASKSAGGLNYANFIDAAGDEIHSAVPLSTEDQEAVLLQTKKDFYSKQIDLIFPIIFPHGKEDLNKFLLDFELSDEQFDFVSAAAKDALVDQLPEVLDSLFDRDMLVGCFADLFESVIDEVLDQPIDIQSDSEAAPLSEEERARQREMDQQVGELVIEAAKFMDLPIAMLERLPGWNFAQKSTSAAIGAAMRKQFNGEFLAKNLQKQLPKLAEKKHIKQTAEEMAAAKQTAEVRYQELERKLAEKTIAYIFSYLGERIKHATDIFTHPALRAVRYAILATCSFVIVKLLGSTLHFLKVDRFVINRLHDFIHHVGHKSLDVFSQKDLHTDVIYQGVEAFEEAFATEMAK